VACEKEHWELITERRTKVRDKIAQLPPLKVALPPYAQLDQKTQLPKLKRRAKQIRTELGGAEGIPITSLSNRCGGVPCVGDSRLKVTYLVELWIGGSAAKELAKESFSQAELDAAIVYAAAHPDCVSWFKENPRTWRQQTAKGEKRCQGKLRKDGSQCASRVSPGKTKYCALHANRRSSHPRNSPTRGY